MLRTTTRTVILALALATASASAALGSTPTLTKAEVIGRGSAICKAAERRVEATPAPRSSNPFAKTAPTGDRARAVNFTAVYAGSLASVRNGLAKLAGVAPRQGRALLTSFIAQLGPTIAALRAGHAAALAHHDKRALADVQRGFALFARASTQTKAYGFPKGTCQSGSS
jgi:hypothetical protein